MSIFDCFTFTSSMFTSCIQTLYKRQDSFKDKPRYNPRQILTSDYIRLLIEANYEPTLNWFDFASISGITAFLQREYSPLIDSEMVYQALKLEPHYKISHRMDAPGCRFIRHKI